MENIVKFYRKIRLRTPYFIAAWPGMGNVAIKTATYLVDILKASEFASFETPDLFYSAEAKIKNATVEIPRFPKGRFYFWKNTATNISGSAKNFDGRLGKSDLIIFISEAQPSEHKGYLYAHKIMEVAEGFSSKKVFTFAAMPVPIEHTQRSNVWFAATHKNLGVEMRRFDVKGMDTGQISGLNGLLLAVAKERGQNGVCLLGEIPLYTIQIDNPKASLAILETLSKTTGILIDLNELRIEAQLQEEEINRLIDYFRGEGLHREPIGEDEIERIKRSLQSYTKLPNSVKTRIEKMFEQVKKDISRAGELKKELDKWSIYKDYEDRFLDLFKDKRRSDKQ